MTFQFLLCKDTLFFSSCLPFSKEKEVLNGFYPFLGEKSPFLSSLPLVFLQLYLITGLLY